MGRLNVEGAGAVSAHLLEHGGADDSACARGRVRARANVGRSNVADLVFGRFCRPPLRVCRGGYVVMRPDSVVVFAWRVAGRFSR